MGKIRSWFAGMKGSRAELAEIAFAEIAGYFVEIVDAEATLTGDVPCMISAI